MLDPAAIDCAQVTLPDGRRLAFAQWGDPEGRPVVALHGIPGSRLQRHPDAAIALRAGARVIHFDRPGFGASEAHAGRTLQSWSADVAAAADAMGIARFAVAGISGGGPYALACAALLGDRITAAAVISGVGPPGSMAAGELSFAARLGFALAPRAPSAVRAAVRAIGAFAVAHPGRYLDIVAAHMGPADRSTLARPDVRAMFSEDLHEAFRQGPAAMVEDLAILARPWRLDLSAVRAPVSFWHGEDDRMIPASASRHLAAAIPGAALHPLPGEGHFMVCLRWPQVLRWLVGD
jgi:pimeloyl-ACP methyl ester carboxylesterase